MANVEGYITVYESTDGGTGEESQTLWQFFVEGKAVSTKNNRIAETMRLAIDTNSKVRVSFDDTVPGNIMLQARIEFKYICESRKVQECNLPEPTTKEICETRRYAPCKPQDIPDDSKS